MCVGLKVLAHDPSFRRSAEGGALLTASTFHWKCYRDLRDTKIQIQYFSFVLGTTFQPTIFPQNSTETILLDNMGPPFKQPHVWISPCLLVIQTSGWWSCIRTMLWSNGNCQQSALWVLRVGPVWLKDMLNIFLWFSDWVSNFKFVDGQLVATASPGRLAPLLQPTTRGPPRYLHFLK